MTTKTFLPCLASTILFTSICYAATDDELTCVSEKEAEFRQEFSRHESATVTIDAPRGKFASGNAFETLAGQKICQTVTIQQSASITTNPRETLDGPPICERLSASLPNRTRILSCEVVNGTPTITAEASGKGCEEDNTASYKITQRILPEVPINTTIGFYNDCKAELSKGKNEDA